MNKPSVGETVADISLPITGGGDWRISDLRGKKIILYFYPKDSTPGCTQQGQAFRDHFDAFQAFESVIVGVSRDTIKSHENFKAKQQFPFELVSDSEELLCQQFDVIKMKNMYCKQVRGIERSTFIIDENGVLVKEWRKVQVKNHIAEVLNYLQTP